jgi:hypothetical protein
MFVLAEGPKSGGGTKVRTITPYRVGLKRMRAARHCCRAYPHESFLSSGRKRADAQGNLTGVSMHREKVVKLTFPPELFHTW